MDRCFAVDLDRAVIPCWHDFSGGRFCVDIEFGRDVVVGRAVEKDHDFLLEGVGGSLGCIFDQGFGLRIRSCEMAA